MHNSRAVGERLMGGQMNGWRGGRVGPDGRVR